MLTIRWLGTLAVAVAASACAGGTIGTLATVASTVGLPSSGGQTAQLVGEVRSIDREAQQLRILAHDGRSATVHLERNVALLRAGEPLELAGLQRGDIVIVEGRQDAQGEIRADRVHVQPTRSLADRHGEIRQFVGRVTRLDQDRGEFDLATQHEEVTITLPFNAPQATVDFFRRLELGATVSVEAVPTTPGRAEIHRFL